MKHAALRYGHFDVKIKNREMLNSFAKTKQYIQKYFENFFDVLFVLAKDFSISPFSVKQVI